MLFPNQLPSHNLFSSKTRVTLFVFPPNRLNPISDQAHRPLTYNVTEAFANKASDAAARAITGSTSNILSELLMSPEAQGVVAPATQPTNILVMRQISEQWRFMVLINDAGRLQVQNGPTAFGPQTEHRVIMYGFFGDEPINRYTQSINQNAMMHFTHKTVIESLAVTGMSGTRHNRTSTRMDSAFCQGQVMANISNDPDLYLVGPTESYKAIARNDNGSSFLMPASPVCSIKNQDSLAISTDLHQPLLNLKHIAQNVIVGMADHSTMSSMSMYNADALRIPDIASETLDEIIGRNMESKNHSFTTLGPNENEMWPMSKFDQTYDYKLQIVDSEQSVSFAARNQSDISVANVFSSLLCNVAPSIIANLGLWELAFRYRMTRELRLWNQEEEYHIDHASSSLGVMTADWLKLKSNQAINLLKTSVFNAMYEQRGDFEVKASFNCAGLSHVVVNFACDPYVMDGVYESPTILDGLMSPIVGNARICHDNALQVGQLVDAMLEDRHLSSGSALDLTNF